MENNNGNRITGVALNVLTPELAQKIDKIFEENNYDSSRLINILLDIQEIVPRQYIPKEIASYVNKKLDVPFSRVYDVISFYTALSSKPRAEYVIQVCQSVVCKVVGNVTLKDSLEKILGIAVDEVTPDERYCLEYTSCFGACDVAPAMRINGEVYGNLTTEDKIKDALKSATM